MTKQRKGNKTMKIAFLGTGHGIATSERSCSAALIECGGAIYYVDCGAPIYERTEALGFDATKVRAVFTTHAHGDHIGGIFQFADLLNWARKFAETKCRFFLTEERIVDATRSLVSMITKPLDECRLTFELAAEGEVYKDENIRVSYIPTRHLAVLDRPSYSILIEGEGKRVLFSGDMSQHLAEGDFPVAAYEKTDIFVCELAHFSLDELSPYLQNVGAKRVAFTHVSPLGKYDEVEKIKGEYPFEILTPSDMEIIEL